VSDEVELADFGQWRGRGGGEGGVERGVGDVGRGEIDGERAGGGEFEEEWFGVHRQLESRLGFGDAKVPADLSGQHVAHLGVAFKPLCD
jgi:hypothetical protein